MLLFVMLGDEEQKVAANSLRPGVLAVLLGLVGNHIVKKEKERADQIDDNFFLMTPPVLQGVADEIQRCRQKIFLHAFRTEQFVAV